MFSPVQWRIALSYIVLLALVLAGLGAYVTAVLRAQQLADLEATLAGEARLIAQHVLGQLATGGADGLDALARQLGREAGVRVTLIGADGRVWGDSDHDPATMDNHATRPEVHEALQQGGGSSRRYSTTLEQDLLYVAVPLERDGALLGVARVALPVTRLQQAWSRLALVVAIAFAAAAVLGTVLSVLIARATTRPIHELTRAARRFSAGEVGHPIQVEGRDELSVLATAFNEMAGRLAAQLHAMEDSRARLQVILDHMADGLILVDTDESVLLINPAAARLLDVEPAAAIGRSATAALRDHELISALRAAATHGSPAEPRLVELGTAAARRTVQVRASVLGGAAAPRTLVLLQDVTELRRVEVVRREFVANVSHDLRTPVAGLKALVETLERGALEDPEAARDFLGRMHVEVDGLAQLVEELLELSRIESGRIPLRIQPTGVADIIAPAAERLRPQAERQGLHLTVDLPPDLPGVMADAGRIQQVVVNLVHNAVKFTPPGGEIMVRARPDAGEVLVSVTDTGAGIAAAALPRLFERFYKVDPARSGGGTGLGLAIAKHLVQAHGGRIWAESAGEGRGATFTFTLPVAPESS